MPKNVMCKNCNNYRCDWCEKVVDSPNPNMPRTCQHFWERTNADRIRAMSDEELAEWIARTQIRAIKYAMTILRLPYAEGDEIVEIGKTEALEWLKQPAEVSENG